jgi:hypothetical protein
VKLNRSQQNKVLEWAGEGLRLPEVKERAAKEDPPFEVDWHQLKWARQRLGARIREMREQSEVEILNNGLSRRVERIRQLETLFDKHLELIRARGVEMDGEIAGGETGLMARDYKGKDADTAVYKYDGALVKEMRGIIDDIAREMGERKTNVELGGSGELIIKVQYGDDGSQKSND